MALVPAMFSGRRIHVTVDICDVDTLSHRLNCHRTTLYKKYLSDPRFPQPVLRLGQSDGWDWHEVQKFLSEGKS